MCSHLAGLFHIGIMDTAVAVASLHTDSGHGSVCVWASLASIVSDVDLEVSRICTMIYDD